MDSQQRRDQIVAWIRLAAIEELGNVFVELCQCCLHSNPDFRVNSGAKGEAYLGRPLLELSPIRPGYPDVGGRHIRGEGVGNLADHLSFAALEAWG